MKRQLPLGAKTELACSGDFEVLPRPFTHEVCNRCDVPKDSIFIQEKPLGKFRFSVSRNSSAFNPH